ncbi:class I SAM-dependent methyltransferase [Flavobacterium cerinum]|uniref:Class I SAM-dependent methyltransferase n=1 Tax=Flavobacterium cerinum TaxID=2502784 RepID=A0A444H9V1_9FLAO|nr:class I SAM-dependent methyltransferase [Flavobacterium cerinum]RWX00062.1 class I SAM-dependent methyltransferase [Flavobacterium cerinum]
MKEYGGDELELFKHAHNWKSYYAGFFRHYLTGDVLEIGAGIGETTHSLCDGSQSSWTCVEPDPALIAEIELKKASGYLPSIVEVKTGLIDVLDHSALFDAIIYIDVLEHIKYDDQELIKASKHLKPGGWLVILVPAHNFLFTKFDKAIGHFRRYNKKMLKDAVPAELKNIELLYLDSVGLTASLANKYFLKQDYPELKQIKLWDSLMVPASRITDKILFHSLGKTVLGIWQKNS